MVAPSMVVCALHSGGRNQFGVCIRGVGESVSSDTAFFLLCCGWPMVGVVVGWMLHGWVDRRRTQ
jgi:hypothetical protein